MSSHRFRLGIIACAAIMAIPLLAGCQSGRTSSAHAVATTVKVGMSFEDFKAEQHRSVSDTREIGVAPLQHHFTILDSGKQTMVLSGTIEAPMAFVFIFRDGILDSIVDPTIAMFNALQNPDDPRPLLKKLLSEEALSDADFKAAVAGRRIAWEEHERHSEPLPIPVLALAMPGANRARNEYARLMSEFDATQIVLGTDEAHIDSDFGSVAYTFRSPAGETVRVYGKEAEIEPYPNPRLFAYFQDGQLTQIVTRFNVPLKPIAVHQTYED